jgi:hypothetical protein
MVEEKSSTTERLLSKELQLGTAPSVCIPKRYGKSISFATFFLLKFCAFINRFSQNDRDMAKNNIKIAYDTFIRTSTHPLDEPGRAAQVVEVLSKTGDSDLRIKIDTLLHLFMTPCEEQLNFGDAKLTSKFPRYV